MCGSISTRSFLTSLDRKITRYNYNRLPAGLYQVHANVRSIKLDQIVGSSAVSRKLTISCNTQDKVSSHFQRTTALILPQERPQKLTGHFGWGGDEQERAACFTLLGLAENCVAHLGYVSRMRIALNLMLHITGLIEWTEYLLHLPVPVLTLVGLTVGPADSRSIMTCIGCHGMETCKDYHT